MKREIKFRAWSSESEKMMPWGFISSVRNLHKLLLLDHITVMQYTGLKDKNRVGIYEGDIIKCYDGEPAVVEWSETQASFVITKDCWAFRHFFGESVSPTECEVIGNIYEHPNLLQS